MKKITVGWVGERRGWFGAVDPGKATCAVALADGVFGRLCGFGVVESFASSGLLVEGAMLWEIPEQRGGAGAPAEDLIWLAAAGADMARGIASPGADVRHITPTKWKGSTPKPIHHSRMWGVLEHQERVLLGRYDTRAAIEAACARGAKARWAKSGATYYRAGDMPTLPGGVRLTHDMLDAVALLMYSLGRLKK